MVVTTANLNLSEFLDRADIDESPAWEYSEGRVDRKPMGGLQHSTLQKRLVAAIENASDRYEAFPELRCTFGNRSIVPDIAILDRDRIPVNPQGELTSSGIPFAPTWTIEILSPNQSQTRVTSKILHCIHHGSQLGWLVDPSEASIFIFQPDRLPDLLIKRDRLPVLEQIDLQLSVDDVFRWLKRDVQPS